ncbi:hypothetical protein NX059_008711 [Plenodomus lindquistii]|nr:hypothetical protein NX059_008711 [Plenodomus lindquistii]
MSSSSITLLPISDTHGTWPYTPSSSAPRADVLIHCGDLTQYGGLPSFQRAIDNIKIINAELKLIIAGNHDVDIDRAWIDQFAEDDEDVEIGAQCLTLLPSQEKYGVYYLDEGTHSFILKDGRSFTVYASPYTPAFGEFGFGYVGEEDRFNEGPNAMPEGVDIVISHGPPAFPTFADYRLDVRERGEHCGCEKLAKALERVRPRLACFGHIHERRGMATVKWGPKELERGGEEVVEDGGTCVSRAREGSETVLVNAAVFGDGKGWLVDFEL